MGKNKTKISISILENLIPMGPDKRLINPRLSVWSPTAMDGPQTQKVQDVSQNPDCRDHPNGLDLGQCGFWTVFNSQTIQNIRA